MTPKHHGQTRNSRNVFIGPPHPERCCMGASLRDRPCGIKTGRRATAKKRTVTPSWRDAAGQPAFLSDVYRQIAVRYVLMAEDVLRWRKVAAAAPATGTACPPRCRRAPIASWPKTGAEILDRRPLQA